MCLAYFCHLEIKFKLHWVWLSLFADSHHSLFSATELDFTSLVPEASEIKDLAA